VNIFFSKQKMKTLTVVFLMVMLGSVFLFLPKMVKATELTDCYSSCHSTYGTSNQLSACLRKCKETKTDINPYFHPIDATVANVKDGSISLVAWLLRAILNLVIMFLSLAEIIFEWIVNPNVMKAIIDNSAIYKSWMAVRDVFNIIFIMTLLFSAFATIFQISKYNYKNILLNLILMALLVNFSYPIARFIIDLSNVIMYGFLQNMSGNYFMTIIKSSGVTGLFNTESTDIFFLLAMIIFTFIFAITLDTIAILLLIRVVSLAIAVIFSPLGFVGSVLPGTKLASKGSEWWTEFLKNCFAGPIMIFMLYIANSVMVAISPLKDSGGDLGNIVSSQLDSNIKNVNGLQQLIISASFVSLPIIILWMGVIAAQNSGIAGAQAVVSKAKKYGKWLAKNPALGSVGFVSKEKGLTDAVKQRWEQAKREGPLGSERIAQRTAAVAARLGVKGALEKDMRRRAEEYKKNGITEDELKQLTENGDTAAAYRLAEDQKLDQATYDKFIAHLNSHKDPSYIKAINSKVKQNRLDIVANNRATDPATLTLQTNIDGAVAGYTAQTIASAAKMGISLTNANGDSATEGERINVDQYVANQQMGNMSADQWNNQNWTDALQTPVARPSETSVQLQRRRDAQKRTIEAARYAWASLSNEARIEVRKRLSPNNRVALSSIDIV
jgi:hypothetical protein